MTVMSPLGLWLPLPLVLLALVLLLMRLKRSKSSCPTTSAKTRPLQETYSCRTSHIQAVTMQGLCKVCTRTTEKILGTPNSNSQFGRGVPNMLGIGISITKHLTRWSRHRCQWELRQSRGIARSAARQVEDVATRPYIHTYVRTHIHAYMHPSIHTYIRMSTHTVHTSVHTCMQYIALPFTHYTTLHYIAVHDMTWRGMA